MLPQFIVAGAARSGTTSLYYYLRQHPGLFLPRKETFFFARDYYRGTSTAGPPAFRNPAQRITGETEYDVLFSKQKRKVTGEISTCYGYLHETSIPLIREKLGDVKILFLLRDPVERAWSGYRHFVRLGYETLSFGEALAHEQRRIAENWDFMWHYARLGFYAAQVKAFRSAFSRVEVITSDSMFEKPAETFRKIFGFIGVGESFVPDTGRQYNFSHEDNQSFSARVLRSAASEFLVKPLARKILPRSKRLAWREYLRKPADDPAPRPGDEIVQNLASLYRDDVQALRSAAGINIENWTPLRHAGNR